MNALITYCFVLLAVAMIGSAPGSIGFAQEHSDLDGITSWDIQLSETDVDPMPDISLIEVDGEEATAELVSNLQAADIVAVCYINAGAWEEWRSDADTYPEAILGEGYPGWDGERFVDIRALDELGPILQDRLDMCVAKGFDAVDPDNIDTYQAETGFAISERDQLTFNRWLATEAHARGLLIAQKNLPDLAVQLEPDFDFAVTEDCLVDGWCNQMNPYFDAGKPVLMIEYTDRDLSVSELCDLADNDQGLVVIKRRELDTWSRHCS